MRGIDKRKLVIIGLSVIIIALAILSGYSIIHTLTPVKVGVLLPVSSGNSITEPLEWAEKNINRNGGIGGRPLELVYKDTRQGNVTRLAQELLADDSIRIVIGPPASDDVYALAPLFAAKKKVLISPVAHSGDISRAFGKNGYYWSTAQGDVTQARVMVSLLKKNGAEKVALLVENSTEGKTFYDWTGFFATESGLSIPFILQFEPGSMMLEEGVAGALAIDPDAVIAICGPGDAITIKRTIDRSGKKTKLFLADFAESPIIISILGGAAEDIEGTSPTSDPSTGFSVAYKERFRHEPDDYAAPLYDAVLLAAYTSARQDATFFESPADSLKAVVHGNGTRKGWDAQEAHDAISQIRAGKLPAVSGTSGPLDYDTEYGGDPLVSYYSHWAVEEGAFHVQSVISSEKTDASGRTGVSASRSRASPARLLVPPAGKEIYVPPLERTGFKAVIVGPSQGWRDYRHQSDALAMYTVLRESGVPDDNIILMVYDDIPSLPENPIRGDVHNVPKGLNLRTGADADYTGRSVTAVTLKNVLLGNRTPETPVVLATNASTDVFVYIASHGSPKGIAFPAGEKTLFTEEDFMEITGTMSREQKYRQIVFMVDTCFGESIAVNTSAKGLLYFTGASASEPSLASVYDMDIRQWLSNEFTATVLNTIRNQPDITFRELYISTYERVTGSHVRLVNAENFGSIDRKVREFFRP